MDLSHFSDADGVVLRRTIVAAGYEDKVIYRALRRGEIVRIRQGAYVLSAVWEAAPGDVERCRLLTAAVRALYDERVAASHVSALIEYGAPTWKQQLDRAHLTHLDGRGDRTAAGVVHHRGACFAQDLTRDWRGWLTSPGRTAMDAALLVPQDAAVVLLDWFLNEGLVEELDLQQRVEAMRCWPDSLGLIHAVALTDAKAESVGETRFRLLCRSLGFPPPVTQFEVRHPSGRTAGRVDFAWPEYRLMVEFDGTEKYLRFRRSGETIEECVLREKRREDLLRELTGWTMLRFTWADLSRPDQVKARLRRAMLRPGAAA